MKRLFYGIILLLFIAVAVSAGILLFLAGINIVKRLIVYIKKAIETYEKYFTTKKPESI